MNDNIHTSLKVYNSNWYIILIGYRTEWMQCNIKMYHVFQYWQGNYFLMLEDGLVSLYLKHTFQRILELNFRFTEDIEEIKFNDKANVLLCHDSFQNYFICKKMSLE